MRKLLYWYVPAGAALIAAAVFADGFYSFVRGNIGTAVNIEAPSAAAAAQGPQDVIVPVILGDSLARGTGDQTGLGIGGRFVDNLRRRQIKSNNITNLGINGARTADLLQQLDHRNVRVVLAQSNTIIISIGGNDLWGDNMRSAPVRDPEPVMNGVLDRVEKVVRVVREANPRARVYVVGLYNPFVTQPFGAPITQLVTRWNAKLVDRFAADRNLVVVETADVFKWRDRLSFDRFHPNDEGYEIIARRIADTF